jgi:hypothetical protein
MRIWRRDEFAVSPAESIARLTRRRLALDGSLRLRRPPIGMFVLATVVAGGWLLREPVLCGAANLWIVSDPISRADAIAVLGGGLETRPFIAAQM